MERLEKGERRCEFCVRNAQKVNQRPFCQSAIRVIFAEADKKEVGRSSINYLMKQRHTAPQFREGYFTNVGGAEVAPPKQDLSQFLV